MYTLLINSKYMPISAQTYELGHLSLIAPRTPPLNNMRQSLGSDNDDELSREIKNQYNYECRRPLMPTTTHVCGNFRMLPPALIGNSVQHERIMSPRRLLNTPLSLSQKPGLWSALGIVGPILRQINYPQEEVCSSQMGGIIGRDWRAVMVPTRPRGGAFSRQQEEAEYEAKKRVVDFAKKYILDYVFPDADRGEKEPFHVRYLITLAYIFACHEDTWPLAGVVRARLEREDETWGAGMQASGRVRRWKSGTGY